MFCFFSHQELKPFFTTKILKRNTGKWKKTKGMQFPRFQREAKNGKTQNEEDPHDDLIRKSLLPGNFQEMGYGRPTAEFQSKKLRTESGNHENYNFLRGLTEKKKGGEGID